MLIKKVFKNNSLLYKCVFYFIKIFGCATMTFEITTTQTGGQWLFRYSQSGVVYNIFLIFVMIISCSFRSYWFLYDAEILFEKKTALVAIIINNFMAVFILVKFCVHQEKFIEITNKIRSIRESLRLISGELLFKKYSTYDGIFNIFFPISIIFCLLVAVSTSMQRKTFGAMLYNASFYPNILTFVALIIQYSVILELIQQLFKLINFNLLHISNAFGFEPFFNYTLKGHINKIIQLRKLYASLSDVSHDLSNFYFQPMFVCTLCTFITLTIVLYRFLSPIIFGNTHQTIHLYFYLILRVNLPIIMLVTLTRSVSAAVIEVRTFSYSSCTMG